MLKFSVVLLIYNPSQENLFLSLSSILKQTMLTSCEIIVADDGSKENHELAVREFFTKTGFTQYKWVRSEMNGGTVQNFSNGIKAAQGKYIKSLGQGDMLHNENVLQQCWDFMEQKNAKFCFGDMVLFNYTCDEKCLEIHSPKRFPVPSCPRLYAGKRFKTQSFFMIVLFDIICGAAMIFERSLVQRLIEEIAHAPVKFCEDLIQIMALKEEVGFFFIPKPVVLYEYNAGICSTDAGRKRILKDTNFFWTWLHARYPEDKYIQKRLKLNRLINENATAKALLLCKIMLISPSYGFWRVARKILGNKKSPHSLGYLESDAFKNSLKKMIQSGTIENNSVE